MNGSLAKALTLKKPTVKINIGKALYFESIFPSDEALKFTMMTGAKNIMAQIALLLPEDEIINPERYQPKELKYFLVNNMEKASIFTFENQESFSKLIDHPVIMDVFKRNLKLPVNSLSLRRKEIPLKDAKLGLLSILNYLSLNSGFLSYRFGIDEAIKMTEGLKNLNRFINESEGNYSFLMIKD